MRLVPSALTAALLALGLPAVAAAAPAPSPGAPAARHQRHYRPTGRLQVRFKDGVGLSAQAAALARVTARGKRVHVDRRVPALNAALLSVGDTRGVLGLLRDDPAVAYVEPESRYQPFTASSASPELQEIHADTVQTGGNTGAGKVIAVIDSEVNTGNADLTGRVVSAGDYSTHVGVDPNDPYQTDDFACTWDKCPHGTGVATAAAASGTMTGVAPGAGIRSYNVFRRFVATDPDTLATSESVGASSADIANALTALGDYGNTHPEVVAVNMSLGGPFDNKLMRDAIAYVRSHAPQITVVVAAGNDGAERANYPAGDPGVISVGATGQIPITSSCSTSVSPGTPWTVAAFSNRGDVDVVAPGRCVSVWYPTSNANGTVNNDSAVRKENGTSFAAPMVAGVAALLAAATPSVTGDAARAAIIAGADHTTASIDTGVGAVRADQAIDRSNGPEPYTAMSVTRGGQLAAVVGRRSVEAIRVEPGGTTAPAAPALSAPAAFGSFSGASDTLGAGITTRTATFAVTPTTVAASSFTISAVGGGGGDDTATVPMRTLDSGDNVEGLPAATGESTSVPLTYGSRSAYIRSANLEHDTMDYPLTWSFTFDPHGWQTSADLFVWEPTTQGGSADGGGEPIISSFDPNSPSGTGTITPGVDLCRVGPPAPYCRTGKWLLGWMTFGSGDSSVGTSRYQMSITYPGPTVTATTPTLASTVSATGPFVVSWGGDLVTKWDVMWTVKKKSSSGVWSLAPWKPWRMGTTTTSGTFGAGGVPTIPVSGETYYFRFQSYDRLGNPSLVGTKYTSAPYDDRYSLASYSPGAWVGITSAARWRGTAKQTGTAGAAVGVWAITSRVTVVGDRCAACGSFRVYIDGVLKATVSSYRSSGTLVRQALWTSATIPGPLKSHQIRIVVLGTAGHPKVVLDGIGAFR